MRHVNWILGLVLLWCGVASVAVSAVRAQVAPPGAHWGTSLYPVANAEERFSVIFHRFTQFSSSGRQHPSGVQETTGFNLATLSITRELVLDLDQRLTWTVEGGAGVSSDQPTESLQNDYLHRLRGLNPVPVGNTRTATEFTAGGAITYWLGTDEPHRGHRAEDSNHDALRYQGFLGAGLGTGTIYHDAFVQVGGAVFVPAVNTRISLIDRCSWPDASEAYPRVANWNNVLQLGVSYVPDDFYMGAGGTLGEVFAECFHTGNLVPWRWPAVLHTLIGRPECGVYLTWDSGFFVEPNGSEIDTQFLSVRFDWPTGMRMETWNDFANGTDFGPTFGLLVSWDLATFFPKTR